MTPTRLIVPLVTVVLSACSSPYRVVQIPQYGADLYPQAQTRSGITVAVEEMQNAERVARVFGADLLKEGILPVNVVVSNSGKQRLLLKPSDILFYQGKEVIDPLPVETVMAAAKRDYRNALLKETTIYPNETYRGVMFFAIPAPKRGLDRFFASLNLYPEDGPRMRVGMTNLESGERVVFPPFAVKLPDSRGTSSY